MYQIKVTDAQYKFLCFALCAAMNSCKGDARNFKDLGILDVAHEIMEDAQAYQNLLVYLQKNKEVI